MDNKYVLARILRKNLTKEERILWNMLRNRKFKNLKFKRQFPIGEYIVDFVCDEKKIIIEIDGGQHNTHENLEKDNARTEFLKSKGYRVIRFWNNDIKDNIKGVFEHLLEEF